MRAIDVSLVNKDEQNEYHALMQIFPRWRELESKIAFGSICYCFLDYDEDECHCEPVVIPVEVIEWRKKFGSFLSFVDRMENINTRCFCSGCVRGVKMPPEDKIVSISPYIVGDETAMRMKNRYSELVKKEEGYSGEGHK